ncbi:CDP-alcohol phosphatidyltransferase family protein [Bifidobacterium choloepi]|uniref:CDP-alcohol phosphatidyltransferase family protein n=1 Tax=Bifidobacterium choloepi TaxID=2614131 RepID=A0A6I5MY27_9BIFI|nr:CDP-alcohol phosphatidyltransferase family protein [Bifidobacterium choloepi]NEG69086.1 CDP-alcohol phosphatidyltransferase family protein [Bifidobacterium choloepi]
MTNHMVVEKKYSPEPRDLIFTVPNLISAFRIISIPIIAYLVTRHMMVASLVLLAISAGSDGLDGLIARKFNQVSKIGQILDPLADRLLIFCSVLALSISHIIPWWMLAFVAARDITMGIFILMLAQHNYGPLPVHFVGKAGTAVLMISIVGLMVADIRPALPACQLLHLFAVAAAIWGIALYWLAGAIYLKQGIPLLRDRSDLPEQDGR